MTEIEELTAEITKFRDERDWAQFHDSKNLAAAISIEAAELNEIFLWKTTAQSEDVPAPKIREELADILIYSFLLAHKHSLSIKEIIIDKIRKNAEKYPAAKTKGKSNKYDEL